MTFTLYWAVLDYILVVVPANTAQLNGIGAGRMLREKNNGLAWGWWRQQWQWWSWRLYTSSTTGALAVWPQADHSASLSPFSHLWDQDILYFIQSLWNNIRESALWTFFVSFSVLVPPQEPCATRISLCSSPMFSSLILPETLPPCLNLFEVVYFSP